MFPSPKIIFQTLPAFLTKELMPTVYIDCTETLLTGGITGVRRVTRQIILHRDELRELGDYEAELVAFAGNRFHLVDPSLLSNPETRNETTWKRVRGNCARATMAWLKKGNFHFPLRLLHRVIETKFLDRLLQSRGKLGRPLDKSIRPGDILFFCENNCVCDIRKEIENFHRRGGQVVALIHDLIPLTHPDFFTSTEIFQKIYRDLVAHADVIISVSKTTQKTVEAYRDKLRASGEKLSPQRSNFSYLGNDFVPLRDAPPATMRVSWRKAFDHPQTFLVCGTLEIRKNNDLVLDAFEILWRDHKDVRLVFIGRYGWKTDDLIKRIGEHPHLDERLYLFTDASDSELRMSYRSSRALISASRAEGFGLPVVEALGQGLPVICSDIPVFHEIAEANASYFDVDSPEELAKRVGELLTKPKSMFVPVGWRWPTWKESVRGLFSKMIAEIS
jgi:glycosyltransferase involved in cell wall biosynthesis